MNARTGTWVRIAVCLLPAGLAAAAGCEDVDWEWESRWWRKRSPQVRPQRETVPSRVGRPPREPFAEESRARPPREPTAETADASPPPVAPSSPGGFHQLYLVSEAAPLKSSDTVRRVRVQHAAARIVARIVEQVYLPVGSGGSEHQFYLIFQDRDEWTAAAELVPLVDVDEADMEADPLAPYCMGLSHLRDVLGAGAAPPDQLVERCGTLLTEAARSPNLDAGRRFAAAILAGRVASDHRYDYVAARSLYDEAARHSETGTVQRLAALWWKAESYDLEGNPSAARAEWDRIVQEYGHRTYSQAVQRARTGLEKP